MTAIPDSPFEGEGETRKIARDIDWRDKPLGPVEEWPLELRTIVRACLDSPFPINLWCGPDLTLIYNDAYRAILGAKHPAAFGMPGREVWAEIWPEIAAMFDQIGNGGPPVYADDAPFTVRRSRIGENLDATAAWFTFGLSPVREEGGNIVAYINVVSESTSRVLAEQAREAARARAERAEARLTEVFAQAPTFLAVLKGPDFVFEYVNDAYCRLVGRDNLVGKPVMEALPELAGQGFDTLLNSVVESSEPYVGREVPILLSRGGPDQQERRFVDFVYYPLTEEGDTPVGVVAHGSDVTEYVLARQEAQRARGDAEEANRAKSQFLATMSHEIRTPINAIMGYTDLLTLGVVGPLTDDQNAHLERIRTSSQHLLTLVEDVLDLARVEAGRLEIDYEHAPVQEAVDSALTLITPQAVRRGVEIHTANDGSEAMYVGDPDRVRQILANLLSNAVKFTPPQGQIRVDFGTVRKTPDIIDRPVDPPITFVRVTDTGIGIAPEEVEAIFRPFVQVETGHTRTRGGTGLGLTISRELARLMGGDLTVESELDAGSIFTLWLPSEGSGEPLLENVLLRASMEERPPNLGLVGAALHAKLRPILQRYVARLREEIPIPGAALLPEAALVDHTSAFVADLAQSLVVLASESADPEYLLQDGSEIQRLLAKLHGRQRARLGWTPEALEQEWKILTAEISSVIRTDVPPDQDVSGAIQLLMGFIDRGERISRGTLRQASGGR